EVVGALKGDGAGLEGLVIDSVGPPEGLALLEGAGGGAGEEAVAVAAGLGVVAGVEAVGDGFRGGDGDVVRGETVEAAGQVLGRLSGGLKARYLPKRVNS